MKKIINPWQNHAEYNCFGCCPDNPIGLHMEFYDDGDNSLVHDAMLCLFQFQRFVGMGIGLQLACAAVDGSTSLQVVSVGGYL